MATKGPSKKPRRRYVCPDCGFRAAHAMGLGRHRSARHGVPSKRQLQASSLVRQDAGLARRYARMEQRLDRIEKQQAKLLQALARLGRIK